MRRRLGIIIREVARPGRPLRPHAHTLLKKKDKARAERVKGGVALETDRSFDGRASGPDGFEGPRSLSLSPLYFSPV